MPSTLLQNTRFHVLGLTALAAGLLFFRLGDLALDPDEYVIIEWAKDLYHSEPTSFDLAGRLIADGGFYPVSYGKGSSSLYPAPNIYLSVISFRIFGVSPWAARLPSALIALVAVPCFYIVARRILRNPHAALVGTLLFATSAPILFLMRKGRYTSTTILLSLWIIWTYMGIMERKRWSIPQFAIAATLFFYTSYYIFFPFIFGLGLHAVLFAPRHTRRIILFFGTGFMLVIAFNTPNAGLAYGWLFQVVIELFHSRVPIMVIDNFRVCANEINLIGFPFLLVPIYVYLSRSTFSSQRVVYTSILLWGGFAAASSSLGPAWLNHVGAGLDRIWPSLHPKVFNRLVDARSWMLLCMLAAIGLIFRTLKRSSSPVTQNLSIPVVIITGAVMAYCVLFPKVWSRYLASLVVVGFIMAGFLLYGIMKHHPVLGAGLLVLAISSNILNVLPFTAGHYPYWQWKLPHWVYRLITGDPVSEKVLDFWMLPPL